MHFKDFHLFTLNLFCYLLCISLIQKVFDHDVPMHIFLKSFRFQIKFMIIQWTASMFCGVSATAVSEKKGYDKCLNKKSICWNRYINRTMICSSKKITLSVHSIDCIPHKPLTINFAIGLKNGLDLTKVLTKIEIYGNQNSYLIKKNKKKTVTLAQNKCMYIVHAAGVLQHNKRNPSAFNLLLHKKKKKYTGKLWRKKMFLLP